MTHHDKAMKKPTPFLSNVVAVLPWTKPEFKTQLPQGRRIWKGSYHLKSDTFPKTYKYVVQLLLFKYALFYITYNGENL